MAAPAPGRQRGVAAPVGMSPELSAALRALPRGHKDDHVLTRVVREGPLKGPVSYHTPNTITYKPNKLQEAAGWRNRGRIGSVTPA
jgi:hypothetical protein